jgi:hypothetical protein
MMPHDVPHDWFAIGIYQIELNCRTVLNSLIFFHVSFFCLHFTSSAFLLLNPLQFLHILLKLRVSEVPATLEDAWLWPRVIDVP